MIYTIRNKDDFYCTPSWATRLIVPELNISQFDVVIEPAAGMGSILLEIKKDRYSIRTIGIEVDEGRSNYCKEVCKFATVINADFFKLKISDYVSENEKVLIITNPPYRYAQRYVERSQKWVGRIGTVCMLLPLTFLGADERKEFWKKNNYNCDLYPLGSRPSFGTKYTAKDGKISKSNSFMMEYAWFKFGPDCRGMFFRLDK